MKSFATAAVLMAGLVVAQDISSLPTCGQTCVKGVLAQATIAPFECKSATDFACLCNNSNFIYGVRDCTQVACDSADMSTTVNFANTFCARKSSVATPIH